MATPEKWRKYLEDYIPCSFPTFLDNEGADSKSFASVLVRLEHPYGRLMSFSNNCGVDVAVVLNVAWGIVLQAYTGQDATCFAVIAESNLNIRPCRIRFTSDKVVSDILSACQSPCGEKIGDHDIPASHLSQDRGFLASEFFNTCVWGPMQGSQMPSETQAADMNRNALNLFDIVTRIKVDKSITRITLTYKRGLMREHQALAVAKAMERAISEIISGKERLDQFCLLTSEDRRQMSLWNMNLSDNSDARIETFIHEWCRRTPSAVAVCGWDGDFSYKELNELSTGVKHDLRHLGIGPEVFIPILFEKSRWAVIAMLGVMKAGGAFILLDPAHPPKRLRSICDKVSARLVVSSVQQADLAAGLAGHVVIVGGEVATAGMAQHVGEHDDSMDCIAAPHNALYAVFTSGSTGTPKGVVNSHSSFLAAMPVYLKALELDNNSRVFQFASYAFDVTIFDTLMTLVAGGCVCVPSNTDRSSDLTSAIQYFGTTHLSVTPTVARILDPRDFPSLKTIVLGGELSASDELLKWVNNVRVIRLYGASECTVMSIQCTSGPASSIKTINYETGNCCWVVNPQNHEQLQPLGAVGELLVEGAVVGRGYLDDASQTSETFIEAPAWLQELRQGSSTVYKSGDLVRIAADKSVQFVCRKSTQVKLRGQRIELGEVENHVRLAIPSATECVVELITIPDASRPPMLMAFVLSDTDASTSSITARRNATSDAVFAEPSASFRSQIASITSKLRDALPSYMVPSVILPLRIMPLTSTDKINRKLLRQLAAALSREDLQLYQAQQTTYRAPGNDIEEAFQRFFAQVLGLSLDQIGADDHFFSLGGDSLTAMRLAAMARKAKFDLTVQNVFDHPELSELARHTKLVADESQEFPQPFTLIAGSKQGIVRDAARQCRLPSRVIEDVYPCTPLQKGLLAETMRDAAAFVAKIEVPLPRDVDLDRLRQAWAAVAKANPILRTRMIFSPSYGMLQVVVREDIPWIESDEVESQELVAVGRSLVQLILRRRPSTALFLHIHHAVYDGYSLPLMFAQLNNAYHGETLAFRPASAFIRYLATMPDATDYWQSMCQGLESPSFPALPHPSHRPHPDSKATHTVCVASPHAREYTPNTHVRLAWAITQAHEQGLLDVFYGTVVSGRNAPVDQIESMLIPTVATVPCRITLDVDSPVRKILHRIQDVATRGIPFEQIGLAEISHLGKDAAHACSFQTLLLMQPTAVEQNENDFFNTSTSDANYRADATYAINLFCTLENQDLSVTALYDGNIVSTDTMQRLLQNLGKSMQEIHAAPRTLIGDILKSLHSRL
nr:lysergyl peptide synthetase subunit 2 [Claviceps purpurea]